MCSSYYLYKLTISSDHRLLEEKIDFCVGKTLVSHHFLFELVLFSKFDNDTFSKQILLGQINWYLPTLPILAIYRYFLQANFSQRYRLQLVQSTFTNTGSIAISQ